MIDALFRLGPKRDPIPIWSMLGILGDAEEGIGAGTRGLELEPTLEAHALDVAQQRQKLAIERLGLGQTPDPEIHMIEYSAHPQE